MKQEIYPVSTNRLGLVQALSLELEVQDICIEMENNGFPINVVEANKQIGMLQERVSWVDAVVLPFIPSKPKQKGTTITKVYKINGSITKQCDDWLGSESNRDTYNEDSIAGSFNRIEYISINLDSPKQVNEWLLSNGWKPKEWNYQKDKSGKEIKDYYGNKIKTSPKLTEESLTDLEELGVAGTLIAYRRKCTHKRNQIKGFLRNLREDGCVPSVVNTLGAATGRMTHSIIANVPAPKEGNWYKDMRKIFYAPDGYVVAGADADQCQVRGLDHYMNDLEFRDALLKGNKADGTDVHSLNGKRAGVSRDHAKNVFYGYLFGAGANKTASQIGCSVGEAEVIRKKFEAGLWSLTALLTALRKFWKKNGYIQGIDGRHIVCHYEHMLLVYLLQDFEAVLMKHSIVIAHREIKRLDLDAKLATIQHDETQWIVREDQAKQVGKILEDSMTKAGTIIGSRCIIKGEAVIGKTWYDTH